MRTAHGLTEKTEAEDLKARVREATSAVGGHARRPSGREAQRERGRGGRPGGKPWMTVTETRGQRSGADERRVTTPPPDAARDTRQEERDVRRTVIRGRTRETVADVRGGNRRWPGPEGRATRRGSPGEAGPLQRLRGREGPGRVRGAAREETPAYDSWRDADRRRCWAGARPGAAQSESESRPREVSSRVLLSSMS